jgi:lysophospholipase L1-like esterase
LKSYRLLRRVAFDLSEGGSRYQDVPPSALVPAVSDADYSANLKSMVRIARQRGAKAMFLSVCSAEPTVQRMRDVARAYDVPMVEALPLLLGRRDDLMAHRLYPDEVKYYEDRYGREVMRRTDYLYISTDGCHPNRAGMSLLADALAEAINRN